MLDQNRCLIIIVLFLGDAILSFCDTSEIKYYKVCDSYTTTLNETDYLAWEASGWYFVESPKRQIPMMKHLKWYVQFTRTWHTFDFLIINLLVPGQTKVKATYSIEETSYKSQLVHFFNGNRLDTHQFEYSFITRERFRDLLNNGTTTVRVDVTFFLPIHYVNIEAFEMAEHNTFDFDLIVEDKQIKAHRSFLLLISPVFQHLIENSTVLNAVLRIDNFTYDTVKTAIDMCYGRTIENLKLSKVMEVLRFAEEYDLKSIAEKMEELLVNNIAVPTFTKLVTLAWKDGRQKLQRACANYLNDHRGSLVVTQEFAELNPMYLAGVIRMAINWSL